MFSGKTRPEKQKTNITAYLRILTNSQPTPTLVALGEKKTSLSDLVLLCSNCHRMIHKKQPWLELHELIEIIE